MRRIVAGMIVVLLVLVTFVGSPAGAQSGPPWLSQESWPLESDGEAVVELHLGGPGRVRYRTFDGCTPPQQSTADPASCEPQAQAPADYTAVDSEVVFTERGSEVIRIPIVDDDLAEASYESFTIEAWQEYSVNQPNPYGVDGYWPVASGSSMRIRIRDNDGLDGSGAVTTTGPRSQPASSGPVLTLPPTPAPIGDIPAAEVSAEVAAPMLEPRPGFDLTGEGSPGPAPTRRGGDGGGGSTSSVAFGLAAAAASVGAVAMVLWRRRWSAARP